MPQALAAGVPGVRIITAEYWHFVATRQPLTDSERRQLSALLEERPEPNSERGQLFLVTPRIGTISPWSSKATDIAWNSGLQTIERIERGVAYLLHARRRKLSATDRRDIAALLHDRMLYFLFYVHAYTSSPVRHFVPRPCTFFFLVCFGR